MRDRILTAGSLIAISVALAVFSSDELSQGVAQDRGPSEAVLLADLHTRDSGSRIKGAYPDAELVYTDFATRYPKGEGKAPFNYFYSPSAKKTFGVCTSNRSLFICDGKVDRRVTQEDVLSGRCRVAPAVLMRGSQVKIVDALDISS